MFNFFFFFKRTDLIHLCELKVDFIFLMKTVLVDVTGGCHHTEEALSGLTAATLIISDKSLVEDLINVNNANQYLRDKQEICEHARV